MALLGLLVGSFVGAAVIRAGDGQSIVSGRSRCDGCTRTLTPLELVPLVSFLALRGRCRTCAARIDPIQPAAEAGGGIVGAAACLAQPTFPEAALFALFGWTLLFLGLSDLRQYWLPRLAIVLLASGALALGPMAVVRHGADSLWPLLAGQAAGAGLGFAILAAPALAYRALRKRDGMGEADPWLLAAVGLWLGPLGVVATLLLAALGGLVGAAAFAVAGRRLGADSAVPLGALLALAAVCVRFAGIGPG